MSRLLTLKEIAKQLEVPESSLRKYREIFSAFIPSVGSGRSRRYKNEAIAILKEIRDMREDMHMPWDAITDVLSKKYPIEIETESSPPPPAQQPDLPAPPAQKIVTQQIRQPALDDRVIKRLLAVSENQTMLVNAMALEVMRSVEEVRKEAQRDNMQLRENITQMIDALTKSISSIRGNERALIRELQTDIQKIEQSVDMLAKAGSKAVEVAQLQEQVRIARQKIKQHEELVKKYKRSVDIMKKENAELRDFKMRHIDSAEDRIREVKAMRKTSPIKRFLGFKA